MQVLRRLVRKSGGALAGCLEERGAYVARLVPEIRSVVADLPEPSPDSLEPTGSRGTDGAGPAPFHLTFQSDGATVEGGLTFTDTEAGVTIRSLTVDTFEIRTVSYCTLSGTALVRRGAEEAVEDFTLTCEDDEETETDVLGSRRCPTREEARSRPAICRCLPDGTRSAAGGVEADRLRVTA